MAERRWSDAGGHPPYRREPGFRSRAPEPDAWLDQEDEDPEADWYAGDGEPRTRRMPAQHWPQSGRSQSGRPRPSQSRSGRPQPGQSPLGWGALPGRLGIGLLAVCAALGAAATVAASSQPGLILGGFVLAGTVIAVLGVEPLCAHLIIPVPVLAYVAAALLAGLLQSQATGTSLTALALGAAQWIAHGFFPMAAATALAAALTAYRMSQARTAARGSRYRTRR